MNQGKIIIAVFILLGILGGLGGWWWNYWISHRAMEFWGAETARLVRLAPKVEYLELDYDLQPVPNEFSKVVYSTRKTIDISQARGLIHLRNAILSDDQYDWDTENFSAEANLRALRFTNQDGKQSTIYFKMQNHDSVAFQVINKQDNNVTLGPLAKSLELFLARELPRAKQEAAVNMGDKQPAPAKSE